MTDEITRFDGKHAFLSNFYPARITYRVPALDREVTTSTLEHMYQAVKSRNAAGAQAVLACETAGQAKRKGRRIVLRDDWADDTKVKVMRELLLVKFAIPGLRQQLLATRDAWIVEGNTWHDTFWGQYQGKGQNMLGLLLMEVRAELRKAR